jgi:putative membrane protein
VTAPLAAGTHWRRLDVRMLLVHPVNELIRFLPAVVAVFVLGTTGEGHTWWHVAAVAVPVALGLLRVLTTRFRITDDPLELRSGLVSRNVLTAPLDRVRTVELTSSPIHRLLGLAKVRIGTGSADKTGRERLELDALALPEARTLRAALLHRTMDPSARPTETAGDRLKFQSGSGSFTAAGG